MHLPDGFLDPRLCALTGLVSAGALGISLRRLARETDPALVPRMGLTAAYLFGAQMVNFPVAAGTSGHLCGSVLAAVLLGPHAAVVVMTTVFLVQAFFFLDGGHTALGANLLNMGLAGTFGGYAVYRAVGGPQPAGRRRWVAAAAAGWVAVVLGASLTAAELALSGAAPARAVFPAMLGVHAVIGLAEGVLTAAALALVERARPDLLPAPAVPAAGCPGARWACAGWIAGAGLALVAALAPLASPLPDGLEHAAERLGFAGRGHALMGAPFPDYTLRGLDGSGVAPALVSLIGGVLAVLACLALARASRAAGGRAAPCTPRVPLDSRVRLTAMLGVVVTAVLLPAGAAGKLWPLLLFSLLWAAAARVRAGWLAGRAMLLLPVVVLAALGVPALRPEEGAARLGLVLLRAGVSLAATAAFVAGTRCRPEGTRGEAEALGALRALRLPGALVHTLGFTLRYLRVLEETTRQMLAARAARSAGAGVLALRVEAAGGILGSLFVRSFERAERVSQAMVARGYRGALPVPETAPLGPADRLYAVGCGLLLLGVWLWP